VLQALL